VEGDPERWLNLIHVEDGAAAILLAEQHAAAGATYNVSDGRPLRRREYFECAARALGLPPPVFAAPAASSPTSSNRRICSRKIWALGGHPRFPCAEDGLRAIVDPAW
jgi:nucleoside-diphosphate-sugar epimerase